MRRGALAEDDRLVDPPQPASTSATTTTTDAQRVCGAVIGATLPTGAKGECSCGRGALRVRCIGRTDDLLIVRGVNLFPTAVREVVAEFRPRVGGPVLIRPAHAGVRQDEPPRVLVELAEGGGDAAELAETIREAIRARLVVGTVVELVPYGTLPRSEYKSRLVDFSESARR